MQNDEDVPYGENFHDEAEAAAWADAANRKRPWRSTIVVCDHLPDGAHTPRHRVLYMTVPETLGVLTRAGFRDPSVVWNEHHMAMYRAHC
jgi:hypothetical protein